MSALIRGCGVPSLSEVARPSISDGSVVAREDGSTCRVRVRSMEISSRLRRRRSSDPRRESHHRCSACQRSDLNQAMCCPVASGAVRDPERRLLVSYPSRRSLQSTKRRTERLQCWFRSMPYCHQYPTASVPRWRVSAAPARRPSPSAMLSAEPQASWTSRV